MNDEQPIHHSHYENLSQIIVKEIDIQPSDHLYGISFIGAPGVGKTTVANLLSQRLGLYIASNDQIRRLLDSMGIDSRKNQDLVEALAIYRTKYLLQHHMSMILDCNLLEEYEKAEYNFNQHHALLFILSLKCDEAIVLKRIEQRRSRQKERNNFSNAGVEDYLKYKSKLTKHGLPKKSIFYTIDTSSDLDYQLNEFERKLHFHLENYTAE